MAGKDSKTKSLAQSDSGKKEGDKEKETQEHCNVFMDITIDNKLAGKVVFKLYDAQAPKTAANFRGLCTGVKPDGTPLPSKITYMGSPFHRIIPGFMVQGGDFERRDGTGGISIYGGKFADEKFEKKHDKIGLLSSANSGPNSNGSQFFITTNEKCDWLDGKHVVFGEVVSGMEVVKMVEKLGSKDGKIYGDKKILIKACGKA